MLSCGAVVLALGWFWNGWFPVNRNLWSSSFVLVTAGWSLILLSVFYWIIDVLGWRRWAFPLIVIGMNAITIYLACRFIDFQTVAAFILERGQSAMHPAIFGCMGFCLEWFLLYLMCEQVVLESMMKQQSPKHIASWLQNAGIFLFEAASVLLLVLLLGWLLAQWATAWMT